MAEQVAGVLLFLVPLVVAAIVAYVVTRPERPAPPVEPSEPAARVVPLERRAVERRGQSAPRRPAAPIAHPTLLHAALSSHLSAVSGAAQTAALSTYQAARLVSIRRPARIPRRPSHRCPRVDP